jgi:hypothetical protein
MAGASRRIDLATVVAALSARRFELVDLLAGEHVAETKCGRIGFRRSPERDVQSSGLSWVLKERITVQFRWIIFSGGQR